MDEGLVDRVEHMDTEDLKSIRANPITHTLVPENEDDRELYELVCDELERRGEEDEKRST